MGNLKQRFIKPGTSFNYTEAVKVLASEAINADQLVYVSASSGPFLTASLADADATGPGVSGKADGRLMIAKHAIPSGGYGVVLPWKLVTTKDTSGDAVGDKVYLSNTPGTAVGANLTTTCPTGGYQVEVGVVTVAATIANGGAMYINAADAERFKGGAVAVGASQRPAETLSFLIPFAGTGGATINLTSMPYPIILTGASMIAGDNSEPALTVLETANLCITCPACAAATGAVSAMSLLAIGNADIPAGGTLRLTKTNGHANDYALVTAIRA